MTQVESEQLAHAIRGWAVEMTARGGSSHVGSVLSMADIIAVLYASVLRVNPDKPENDDRDRLILSKGHAGAGLYAALAERGFFPKEWLLTHCQDGSKLSGHVSSIGIPGVEFSTGSLGHGLPVATGLAFAARRAGALWKVYCVMSDGECDEGTTWEAALLAAHHRLENLTVVVDFNGLQSLRSVASTVALEPFADKWRAFGWAVSEVDGHSHQELRSSLTLENDGPSIVIARTVKGKGVPFMENSVLWHYRAPAGDELEAARAAIGFRLV
jgi:transketolase